jgi:hypothetical protein
MDKLPVYNISQHVSSPVCIQPITEAHTLFVDSRPITRFVNTTETDPVTKKNINVVHEQHTITGVSNVDFTVDLNYMVNGSFRNVTQIELLGFSMSNKYLIESQEHYVVLDIKELKSRLCSSSIHVDDKFCTIYFDVPEKTAIAQMTKAIKGIDFDRKYKTFEPKLNTLSKLTIKILNGNTGKVIDDHGYITLLFKIKTSRELY